MQNIKLQKEVEVQEFHGMDNEDSYVVSYQNRHWKVSGFVVDVIRILQQTNSFDALTTQLTKKYGLNQIDAALAHTIDFLEKNGLLSGQTPKQTQKRINPHIWGRLTLFPEAIVQRIKIFCFLFYKPLLGILSTFSVLWIVYATTSSSASDLSQQIIQLPLQKLLLCYGLMLLIGLLHELGHASALMFCGEKPGRIGFAFYILSYVLFSDVSNAWKLKRMERLLVDYGGIYFQSIFSAIIYIVNFVWIHNSVLEIVTIFETILVLGNFNPFFKYDGYWMLSDVLGTTNVIKVVLEFWKGVFQGGNAKSELQPLSIKLKFVIILYTIASVVYMVYFAVFVSSTAINTTRIIYFDIKFVLTREITIGLPNIVKYITSRFSTYLFWLIIFRLVTKGIKSIYKLLKKGR